MLDAKAEAKVAACLVAGENLLWAGRPREIPWWTVLRPGLLTSVLVIAITLPTVGPVGSRYGVGAEFVPLLLAIVLGPVLVVMLGSTLSSLYVVRGIRRRTVYAVTDQRGLHLTGGNLRYVVLGPQTPVRVRFRRRDRGRLEMGVWPPYLERWGILLSGLEKVVEQRCLWFPDCPRVDEAAGVVRRAAAARGSFSAAPTPGWGR